MSEGNSEIKEVKQQTLEEFFIVNQDTLEKGFDEAFKNLNASLITTINSAFTTMQKDNEVRSQANKDEHDRKMGMLTSSLSQTRTFFLTSKDKKKQKGNSIVENFQKIQNLKKKGRLFSFLKEFTTKEKNGKMRGNVIIKHLEDKRKNLIFNSWRNLACSYKKQKLKLNEQQNTLAQIQIIQKNYDCEMEKLKAVLESLQKDIQKEIDERNSLAKLYDLSLKKGVEKFLQETNYIVDFDSSGVITPHDQSYIDPKESVPGNYPLINVHENKLKYSQDYKETD